MQHASDQAIAAEAVPLVLPAGLRHEVAGRWLQRSLVAKVTHVLFSKLDEVPADHGLAELAEAMELPARWVSDGHDIPGALAPAAPRILGALGLGREKDAARRQAS